jgi:hypothetical protein
MGDKFYIFLAYSSPPFLNAMILSAGFGLGKRGRGFCELLDGLSDPDGFGGLTADPLVPLFCELAMRRSLLRPTIHKTQITATSPVMLSSFASAANANWMVSENHRAAHLALSEPLPPSHCNPSSRSRFRRYMFIADSGYQPIGPLSSRWVALPGPRPAWRSH